MFRIPLLQKDKHAIVMIKQACCRHGYLPGFLISSCSWAAKEVFFYEQN